MGCNVQVMANVPDFVWKPAQGGLVDPLEIGHDERGPVYAAMCPR